MSDETPDAHETQDGSHETRAELQKSGTELEIIGVRQGSFGVHGTGDTSGFGGLRRPIIMPGAATPPFGGWYDEVAERLAQGEGLADAIEKVVIDRGEITFFIRRAALPRAARHLRDDEGLRFEMLSGVSGVHFPGDEGRELHAVYHLLSMTHNRRIRLEVTCPEDDPHIPSVVDTHPTADWHEREAWDMFGIVFDGHPHLTRILMPDDWQGHPQRKDYPLGGIDVEFKGGFIPAPDNRRSYS